VHGAGSSLGGAAEPSKTSQFVALCRAGMRRPHSPEGDPHAQESLCAGMHLERAPSPRPDLVARTRFVDDRLSAALSSGVLQVVIVGAGYDDRALRFRSTGVRFWEVDHPTTQADKSRRLRAIGANCDDLVLVPADLRRASVESLLRTAGHDPSQRSIFVCEGVLVYLGLGAILRLLTALRAVAARSSTLVTSLATHRPDLPTAKVVEVANRRRVAAASEPWLTILPPAVHLELVERAGWRVREALDPSDLEAGSVPGRGLLVRSSPL
jgi:methyltransferase (TIGR00027 family)